MKKTRMIEFISVARTVVLHLSYHFFSQELNMVFGHDLKYMAHTLIAMPFN